MFPFVASSLTVALGLGVSAVEFPLFQNILFVGAAMSLMAFCCALEVWSSEHPADSAQPAPEPHEPLQEAYAAEPLKKAA